MKKSVKQSYIYYISPFITCCILLTVYFMKGIFPFGSRSVAYYDMVQQYIPFYYKTWDILHGLSPLTFDWSTGLGSSWADNIGNYILSPFNLFFYFISRDGIFNSMSFFLMLKLAVASFFMSFYVLKSHKNIKEIFALILGISYAFCAYNLQYYSNIQFLDIVALFPLLVYGHDLLLKKNKYALYLVMLTLSMIISIYLSYMICVYLVIRTFLIIRKEEQVSRFKTAFIFSVISLVSFLLSSVVSVPAIYVLLSSNRSDVWDSQGGYWDIIRALTSAYGDQYKYFMLFGCEGALAIIVFALIFRRDYAVKIYDRIVLIALLIVPVFVEGTNLLWHIGGYVHFPMRFGYILSFESLSLIASYISTEEGSESIKTIRKISLYFSFALIPVVLFVLYKFITPFSVYGIRDISPYPATVFCILSAFICIVFCCICNRKNHLIILLSAILVCQCTIGTYGFVGPEKEWSAECSSELLASSIELDDLKNSDPGSFVRYKNIGNSLVTNYPLVTGLNSCAGWTSGNNSNLLHLRDSLGYSTAYTRILDEGGTVFSDELFGVGKIISRSSENISLYSYEKTVGDFNVYSSNYVLPFVINIDHVPEIPVDSDIFDYQNLIFSDLTGIDKPLITNIYSYFGSFDEFNMSDRLHFDLEIDGEKTLYVYTCGYQFGVLVNYDIKAIPYLNDYENFIYPTAFTNGLLECGTYKDEYVSLDLIPDPDYSAEASDYFCIMVGEMDMSLLREGNAALSCGSVSDVTLSKSSLRATGMADSDGYLLMPVGYNDGFECLVNGKKINLIPVLNDALILIPITEGEYDVQITYLPKGLYIGLILTALGALALITFILYNRKSSDKNTIILNLGKAFYYLIVVACILMGVFMYLIPVACNILFRIMT